MLPIQDIISAFNEKNTNNPTFRTFIILQNKVIVINKID